MKKARNVDRARLARREHRISFPVSAVNGPPSGSPPTRFVVDSQNYLILEVHGDGTEFADLTRDARTAFVVEALNGQRVVGTITKLARALHALAELRNCTKSVEPLDGNLRHNLIRAEVQADHVLKENSYPNKALER